MNKFFFLYLIVVVLSSCQSKPVTGESATVADASYQSITVDKLHTMLNDKEFVLINVHIPFAGDIAGTDLSIPYDQITKDLSQLPTDKNAKIVLYCRSGRMSEIAAQALSGLGYTNIQNLSGGMIEWEQAGYKIEE